MTSLFEIRSFVIDSTSLDVSINQQITPYNRHFFDDIINTGYSVASVQGNWLKLLPDLVFHKNSVTVFT